MRNLSKLLGVSLLSFTALCANIQDNLQVGDIHKIMEQMLSQHVEKKEITPAVIQASLTSYIQQFDPNGLYLLSSEVNPYVQMSDSDLEKIVSQYQQSNYSTYKQLNTTIQQAILRERKLRTEIQADSAALFAPNAERSENWYELINTEHAYSRDLVELKARIKFDIIQFIQDQKKRFGDTSVVKNKDHILKMYDNEMRDFEDGYLGTTDKGNKLTSSQEENLFAMHVLKALANTLDSHSKFMDKEEAYDMKTRLEKTFQGIGVELQERPEGIVVTGMTKGGPAEKSGKIKINDVIIAVDGNSVDDESFETVLKALHEQQKPSTLLTLKRLVDGKPETIQVKLNREAIAINEGRVETSYETYNNGIIGRIALHMFYQGENGITSENDVRNAIKQLDSKGDLQGLILDLRDNSGGFLMQAVKVAGLFITEGVIVVSKYSNGEEHYYRDVENKRMFNGPLIILTSKETASAAEIVSQALQDYGVALIVGDAQTYGKGTIQSQTVTTNDGGSSYFKVTVGKYYTVSGKTPQKDGVKADVLVPSKFSGYKIGESYLDNVLSSDKIAPSYEDTLADIDDNMKGWYAHYYTPNLQKKVTKWRDMLPTLKKQSRERMENNKEYSQSLKTSAKEQQSLVDMSTAKDSLQQESKQDAQLSEAVNIVKDMIQLENNSHK